MRFVFLFFALWLALAAARPVRPTNVAFDASNPSGMLVIAEHGGAAYDPGRYRFVRLDRSTARVLETVDIPVGPRRGQFLLGGPAWHIFHYALVPPGDYALVYLDSSATSLVTNMSRWRCLPTTTIYSVGAGAISVVRVPDRNDHDVVLDNSVVRRRIMNELAPGEAIDSLYSPERAEAEFAAIVATNTRLTAPYAFVPSVGTLTFGAQDDTRRDACIPGAELSIGSPQ